MLVPFDAHPVWLRASWLGARASAVMWKCSVTIRSSWSVVSTAPAQTPRMLYDVYRTLSLGIAGTLR
jgi:hypothetical protein